MERQCSYPWRSHGRFKQLFLRKKRSKACREKSADTINIPILANVYVVKGLAVKVGIQPAFKVNEEMKMNSELGSGSKEVDSAESFDFSIPGGLSYEFNNVVLDARYNFGVTSVADGGDAKNSVFQFTLGYKFAL